jgi:predicted Zn-dependent protease
MASFVQQANVAVTAGKFADAVALLTTAARAYPADKTAPLRIAQISFDCQEYGDAITHANKVLERDPDDIIAHSILAVSGLRVSSKALADLSAKKRISGDVRDAAQDLAKILRTSIGGDILPPPRERKLAPHVPRPSAPAPVVPLAGREAESLLDMLGRAPNQVGKK